MAESVEELTKVLMDNSAPMEERIEAAAKLYEYYLAGVEVPLAITEFARKSVDELREIIESGHYAKGTEEEAIVKGLYKAKVEVIRRRLSKMSLIEIAKVYASPSSNVEKEIAGELLSGKEEELEKEVKKISLAVEVLKQEAIKEEAEFIKGNIPRISQPTQYRFLSDLQIKSIKKPSKFYAKEAFKSGLWNLEWGDPEEYGINVKTYAYYVDRPMNKDFALMMKSKGIWFFHWGDLSEYL